MSYELHHSGIITGCVNCFCLACDSSLEDSQEAFRHTKTSSHRERLSAVPYLDMFQDQYIRKFTTGYYCEFCNKLMSSAVQVGLHVAEEHHKQKKGTHLLKPFDHGVIAFNKVLINERAWHGLAENVCYICEIEFNDKVLHKSDTSHLLNLIQRPVKFGVKDMIYREINNSTIQCLTCNLLLSSTSLSTHCDEAEHLNHYASCIAVKSKETNDTIEKDNNEKLTKTITLSNDRDKTEERSKTSYDKGRDASLIVQRTAMYQSNHISVNYETEVAFCRKCLTHIGFDSNDIEKHIKEHSSLERPTSPVLRYPVDVNRTKYCTEPQENKMDKECLNNQQSNPIKNIKVKQPKTLQNSNSVCQGESKIPQFTDHDINNEDAVEAFGFAKDNNITYNLNNGKSFCRTCQVDVPSALKSMKEHVKGIPHTKNCTANKPKVKNTPRKQIASKYIRSVTLVESFLDSGYLINEIFFIDRLSFWLLQKNGFNPDLKCLLCGGEVNISSVILNTHIKNCCLPTGRKTRVVITDEHEFIREIRPESFHCAHCNVVVFGWNNMESHLLSSEHDREKNNSMIRHGVLCRYLPLHALLVLEM